MQRNAIKTGDGRENEPFPRFLFLFPFSRFYGLIDSLINRGRRERKKAAGQREK